MRLSVLLVVLWSSACSGPSAPASRSPEPLAEPPPPVAPAEPAPAVTGRGLFCAYGGVGIVPDPLPPGYETMFAAMAFEVDNPGPPLSGVTVATASLRDATGAPIASLLRLDHFVDLSAEPAPDPTWGSFAVYLNGTGTPFTGTLPTGTTRLRVRYAISDPGMQSPDHCHLELAGFPGGPVSIEGRVDGVWPTS